VKWGHTLESAGHAPQRRSYAREWALIRSFVRAHGMTQRLNNDADATRARNLALSGIQTEVSEVGPTPCSLLPASDAEHFAAARLLSV